MTYLIKIYLVRVKIHIPQVLKVSYKTEINPYVGINMFVYLYVYNLNYNIHIFAVTWIIQFIWVIIDLMPIIKAWKTKKKLQEWKMNTGTYNFKLCDISISQKRTWNS